MIAASVVVPVGAFGTVVKVKSIKMSKSSLSLYVKKTYKLKVYYTPSTTTQKRLIWTTSNSKIASVDAYGKVTARVAGKAYITARSYTNRTLKTTCVVTVKKVPTTYASNGLSKTTKVNLKMAFFQAGAGRAWMDYAISAFKKKFPNVTITMTASPTIDKIISTKLNANNNTDMFHLFSSCRLIWQPYAENGKIDNLDALWNRKPYDGSKALKYLTQPDLYKYQVFKNLGHTYGIPYAWHVAGSLFYHKEFFVSKKWNQAPRTYAQFTALCDTIKASGIYPMCFYEGYLYGLMKPKEFELAAENGNTKFNYNYRNYVGKQYTTPEAIEMYNAFYDMGKKKYFEPGSGTMTHIASQMNIIQHKVAMVVGGSWLQNEMKGNVPTGFSWGFMTMPLKSKTTSKAYTQLTCEDTQLVWSKKGTLAKKWAKEFVLFMQNLNVQYQIVKKGGMISTRSDFSNSATRKAAYTGVLKTVTTAVNNKTVAAVEISSHAKRLKDPSGFGDIAYNMVADVRVNIALGKTDPDATLESAETWYAKAQATGYK